MDGCGVDVGVGDGSRVGGVNGSGVDVGVGDGCGDVTEGVGDESDVAGVGIGDGSGAADVDTVGVVGVVGAVGAKRFFETQCCHQILNRSDLTFGPRCGMPKCLTKEISSSLSKSISCGSLFSSRIRF